MAGLVMLIDELKHYQRYDSFFGTPSNSVKFYITLHGSTGRYNLLIAKSWKLH